MSTEPNSMDSDDEQLAVDVTTESTADSDSAEASGSTKYGHLVEDDDEFDPHRATDEFPAGEECDLTCSSVPNDETGFVLSPHYSDRRANRQHPEVTDRIVDMLLNDSEVRLSYRNDEYENDRYLFQRKAGKYEWTLVVAHDPDVAPEWVLVSVYSNYHGSVGTTNRYFERKQQERGDR